MAASDYTIVTQYPDVEVLGGTRTQDVQVIGVVTGDHGVYWEGRVPRAMATTTNLHGLALANTVMYEALFDIPGVDDVQWTQEPTASGELQDHVLLYVVSASGQSTGVINAPLSLLTTDYINPRVAKLRAALNATEG